MKERNTKPEKEIKALEQDKQQAGNLLPDILPAESLTVSGILKTSKLNNITVMYLGFVNGTSASEKIDTGQLIEEIKIYNSAFDEIIAKHGLRKIKTIGDSYMCAGMLPVPDNNASTVVNAALEIHQFFTVSNIERAKYNLPVVSCRIGIHSATVVADILNFQQFADDIWEDMLNLTLYTEAGCEPKKINISGSTYTLIKNDFNCTYRGKIAAKNNGFVDIYFLDDENNLPVFSPAGAENFIRGKLKRNLPPQLTYHGYHHTEDVLNAVLQIGVAENIAEEDMQLLRIAALFHDSGFTELYKNHEEKGCDIAKEYLPLFGFSQKDTDCIAGMIMATKIPQQPQTKLQEILCDADLDYLGRDDFYTIGNTLLEELITYSILQSEEKWNELQVNFLSTHQYFTNYSKRERQPQKQQYLEALKKELALKHAI